MDIETLYESGYLPEIYYNQLKNKTPQENYKKFKIGKNTKKDSFLLSLIQNSLKATMEIALNEIFKNFNTK